MNNLPASTKKRSSILPALLIFMGGSVLLFAAWSAINSPVLASIMNAPKPQQDAARSQPFAQVNIAKPSISAVGADASQVVVIPIATATLSAQPEVVNILPTVEINPQVEIIPTAEVSIYVPPADLPTAEQPTAAPDASSPGVIYAEVIADTPTPEFAAAPTVAAYAPVTGSGEHWIDVDLSQQRVYAYEGDTVVNSFIVSTGTWQTPTVTGKYNIWVKLKSAPMSGPGYYLPNVPYVMYFFGSYGLHGTYWHNNFGTPMSHGCVNLSIPDSEWLYNFSSVGTVVNVHY